MNLDNIAILLQELVGEIAQIRASLGGKTSLLEGTGIGKSLQKAIALEMLRNNDACLKNKETKAFLDTNILSGIPKALYVDKGCKSESYGEYDYYRFQLDSEDGIIDLGLGMWRKDSILNVGGKNVIEGLANATPEQLAQPIEIVCSPSDSDNALAAKNAVNVKIVASGQELKTWFPKEKGGDRSEAEIAEYWHNQIKTIGDKLPIIIIQKTAFDKDKARQQILDKAKSVVGNEDKQALKDYLILKATRALGRKINTMDDIKNQDEVNLVLKEMDSI